MGVARRIGWSKRVRGGTPLEERGCFGAEFVEVHLGGDEMTARGVAVGSTPFAYRLDYELETAARFVTARLVVSVRAEDFGRTLELRRAASGAWTETVENEGSASIALPRSGMDAGALSDALDVDLELSPLFNSMPVLRHDLLRKAGPVDFVMAWVSVPDLAVHRSPQRYSLIRTLDSGVRVVRFESLAGDGFAEDIHFDADGLVIDYPGIAERLR
jgi:hypothetical protein